MYLDFPLADILPLLSHAFAAETNYRPYCPDENAEPGLVLVGDQGVYLMSNGKSGLYADGIAPAAGEYKQQQVVYGIGCNPHTDNFETWRDTKDSTFGGDDGVELLTIPREWHDRLPPSVAAGTLQYLRISFENNDLAMSLRA